MRGSTGLTSLGEFGVAGVAGGWLMWVLMTGLLIAGLSFLISLATRRFLSGAVLVLVTTSLALLLVLLGLASGMAQSDFKLGVVLPYVVLSIAIAAAWLLFIKARTDRS